MKWYTKYLQVYEQPFDSAPKEAVDFVKTKLQKLSENKQPLASVILICYNEEKRLLSCYGRFVTTSVTFRLKFWLSTTILPIELKVCSNSWESLISMSLRKDRDMPANAD